MKRVSLRRAGWTVCVCIVVVIVASHDASDVSAAIVNWGDVFTIDDPTDISRPPGSSNIAAIEFNTIEGYSSPGGDNMINGILFSRADLTFFNVGFNFDHGPVFDPTNFPGSTGDQDLDDLLDSYSYRVGPPANSGFTVAGLVTGSQYQIQVIGISDSHLCCSGQTYELDALSSASVTARHCLAPGPW